MQVDEVHAVLDALDGVGCRAWVSGGWGVDALVGRQTRVHRDLDLAVDADLQEAALGALGHLGYTVQTDWLPVRVELGAPGKRWVDLHPLRFDEAGDAVQAGLDGAVFLYPSTCSSTASPADVKSGAYRWNSSGFFAAATSCAQSTTSTWPFCGHCSQARTAGVERLARPVRSRRTG